MSLVVIDNATIDSLLRAEELLRYIPCLANPQKAATVRRGCCDDGGSAAVDYGAIKNCLAGLDTVNTRRIKDFLGATQIRFYRPSQRDGKPVTIKHTK